MESKEKKFHNDLLLEMYEKLEALRAGHKMPAGPCCDCGAPTVFVAYFDSTKFCCDECASDRLESQGEIERDKAALEELHEQEKL